MKLQSALSVLILGSNSFYGNAFASNYAATNTNLQHLSTTSLKPFRDNFSFVTHSIRGGSISSSGSDLSSTKTDEDVNVDVCPTSVAKYISSDNWSLLSTRGKQALTNLINGDEGIGAQEHVYKDWPESGVDDEGKMELTEQLADLDISYPGGLTAYLSKARILLKESADGTNPFTDFSASVPSGESLSYDQPNPESHTGMTFSEAEQMGLTGIKDVAFVLVAGGLGERLGYSGIKLSLETNLLTNKSYLEIYIKYIQAMQHMAEKKTGESNIKIPLVIMTSGDTDPMTRQLLADNNNFGMDEDQIQIVCQDKVAALKDSVAGLSLKSQWKIETKPHGHGDVHHLLYREGHVDKWEKEGRKHVIFLQDTNALVINSILPTLGVSIAKKFDMNSICIPRLAGEAAGAITSLEHNTDPEKSLVINVEYNQLDPLLKTQGDCKGDVPDESGFSPYPGNANNIVISIDSYAKTLRGEDQGVVVEFVNPKYKDETRTEFKKATRLECMMQDIPKLFQKELGSEANIGFTTFDRWFTFSPAKNSLESGIDAVKGGNIAPGTMSSAESDKYIQNQRKLKHAGMDIHVTEEEDLVAIGGIPVTAGPRIILCPGFAITQEEVVNKIHGGSITQRSSLVLEGQGLVVKNLQLDGALIIRTGPECEVEIDGLTVQNKGYELEEIPEGAEVDEAVSIRGYTMSKHEAMEIVIEEPGKYYIGKGGVVEKRE
mmetsp:Transcript_26451/g.30747  ORF Transcript_26451/g.30747 Transcript_26451/m.30747 type:complete len:718 (+) Transcript_26451:241-2394(+)